jgi:peptidoglycan/LPS O-acetylase OafA/YrhL
MDTASTRTSRRDAIDVARCLALFVVVFGHLAMAVVDRPGGAVRGANLLALRPNWAWVAVAAPMPVFFAAAGWANATTTFTSAATRLRTLVGLAAVVVAVWSAAVVVVSFVVGGPGAVGSGARLATQPLWFLAAYLPLAAAAGPIARLAARRPIVAIGGCLGLLAVLDVIRFGYDGPAAIGWAGFLVAWSVPWLAGAAWRARSERGAFVERRVGLALLAGFGAVGALLVAFGGYQVSLIDAVPGGRSNTSPPTLYTAVVGVAQVGALMLAARALDRLGRRARRLFDAMCEASVGIYVWHLTALSLCVCLIAVGAPTPERLTATWWLTRPVWFAIVLGLAAALVLSTATVRQYRRARPLRSSNPAGGLRTGVGIAVASVAAAVVGLEGPRTTRTALLCTALFAGGYLLLRDARVRDRDTGSSNRVAYSVRYAPTIN